MKTYKEYLSAVNDAIDSLNYPEQPSGLYEPIRYILKEGGKRLRPVLTLATAEAFGTDPERALRPAIAIEMFHNFTLLHDDVMDRADLRRGRPTVHKKWNEATAILSGDAMLTLASVILSQTPTERLAEMSALLNQTAMEVYEGQQYDMDFEHRLDVSEDEYIEMIRLKTSVLLGCACRMGALLANADSRSEKAIYDFGVELGLAFQLRDDYLDTYGDTAIFGKATGGDILNNKKTWLSVAALSDPLTADNMRRAIEGPLEGEQKIAHVKEIYAKANLPERIRQLIGRYSESALRSLAACHFTPAAMQFFEDLVRQMTNRDK